MRIDQVGIDELIHLYTEHTAHYPLSLTQSPHTPPPPPSPSHLTSHPLHLPLPLPPHLLTSQLPLLGLHEGTVSCQLRTQTQPFQNSKSPPKKLPPITALLPSPLHCFILHSQQLKHRNRITVPLFHFLCTIVNANKRGTVKMEEAWAQTRVPVLLTHLCTVALRDIVNRKIGLGLRPPPSSSFPLSFTVPLTKLLTLLWYFLSFKTSGACKDDKRQTGRQMEKGRDRQTDRWTDTDETVRNKESQRSRQMHSLISRQTFSCTSCDHKVGEKPGNASHAHTHHVLHRAHE